MLRIVYFLFNQYGEEKSTSRSRISSSLEVKTQYSTQGEIKSLEMIRAALIVHDGFLIKLLMYVPLGQS